MDIWVFARYRLVLAVVLVEREYNISLLYYLSYNFYFYLLPFKGLAAEEEVVGFDLSKLEEEEEEGYVQAGLDIHVVADNNLVELHIVADRKAVGTPEHTDMDLDSPGRVELHKGKS